MLTERDKARLQDELYNLLSQYGVTLTNRETVPNGIGYSETLVVLVDEKGAVVLEGI